MWGSLGPVSSCFVFSGSQEVTVIVFKVKTGTGDGRPEIMPLIRSYDVTG